MSRRYDSEEAKRIITEKAFELFSLHGYNQTSIGDIAKASGYSKGHIYYHFENKEKLFVQLAQKSMREWHLKWIDIEPTYSSATEKWYGMAKHVLYNYQTPLLRAGQELGANPTSSPESVRKLFKLAVVPMSSYRSIFIEGIERDEFENGNVDEWTALLGTWLGGLCQLTNTQPLQSLEPLFEQAITIFLSSIKKRGS